MKYGDKVRTPSGAIETVAIANGIQVITEESAARGSWYHPTKVFLVTTEEDNGNG